jgi:membrane-bound lytic murein transglycosylase D
MRWVLAIACAIWGGSGLGAEPASLLSFSYSFDRPRAIQGANENNVIAGSDLRPAPDARSDAGGQSPADRRLPLRLEELLLTPEVALPAASSVTLPYAPPVRYADLWDRIRAGFAMPDLDSPLVSPLVDRWQAWYLSRPLVLKGILDRSRRYLYHVVEELDRRGMPLELALLPMVESGYDPAALSSAKAAGMWQFIPSTARNYGLGHGPDYDERRDIVASTAAALDYLQFLHETFGDWQLALAGYNWGEKAVQAAIERNAQKDRATRYASLVLPEETRNYLPKLQALKNLVAYHRAFGIEFEPIPNEPYFVTVNAGRTLDLVDAARLAGAPLGEITSLNPGHATPDGTSTPLAASRDLVLPADKADAFLTNLQNLGPPTAPRKTRKKQY